MPAIEVSQLPLIHRPCLLDPMAHPANCDRESCKLYPTAMDLVEALSHETDRSQADVMKMLGQPHDPVLYAAWKRALRDHIGDKARLCKFDIPLLPQDSPPELPAVDS